MCVCVRTVHLFLIRSDPSRLAVMDYIAPVERDKQVEREREGERELRKAALTSCFFSFKKYLKFLFFLLYLQNDAPGAGVGGGAGASGGGHGSSHSPELG